MNALIDDIKKWHEKGRGKDLLKVLSGIRGGGKTYAMQTLIDDLRAKGEKENSIVLLDFESPEMRQVKTHTDVLRVIQKKGATGRVHLFLDEITGLLDFEVLMGVLYGLKEYDITVSTSNRRLFNSDVRKYFEGRMSEFTVPPPRDRQRDKLELERVWGTMFLRDVLGGHSLADATAEERLAEFFSDRLGEQLSMRKISQALVIDGHNLHPNTISTYTDALVDAYLVEAAPIYDTFEKYIMNTGCRYFWMDPDLRANRFGASPEFETERRRYNEVYLELRRTRGKVMCIRSSDTFANFVVFGSDGEPEEVKWKEF